ncbi:MAG: enoyl-CoA hydratase [Pseudomonadota bacterium]
MPEIGEIDTEIAVTITDRVGWITFNRPDVLNAFSDSMRARLLELLEGWQHDDAVGCVVLTGAGRAFCAGGDVPSMAALQRDNDTTVVENRMVVGGQVVQLIQRLPKPVIAAINGPAAGAGMNLALACDMRFGAEDALFSESFVKIGLVPDWGGFYFLPRLIGTAKAMELMMLGDRIPMADALRLGLVNDVLAPALLAEHVQAIASRLASGPSEALRAIKEGVMGGASGSLEQALAFEYRAQKTLFLSDDAREGMQAFIDKRAPVFRQ